MKKTSASKANKVFITYSDKGGVGKSMLARLILNYHRTNNIPCAAFETDLNVGQLMQFYPDPNPLIGCGAFDIKDEEQASLIIDALEAFRDCNILIDLPGGVIKNLQGILGKSNRLTQTFIDMGFELHIIIPITPFKSSIRPIRIANKEFGNDAIIHVFKQLYTVGNKSVPFPNFEEKQMYTDFPTEKDFLVSVGGDVFDLPAINTTFLADYEDVCELNLPALQGTQRGFGDILKLPITDDWGRTSSQKLGYWIEDIDKILKQIV